MWQKVVDYAPNFLLGGAGLSLLFYITFHWRAVCRQIDRWEAKRSQFWGHSEKYIAFNKNLTPPYLLFVTVFLFIGSVALLAGFGAPLITLPRPEEQKPIAPISVKPQ